MSAAPFISRLALHAAALPLLLWCSPALTISMRSTAPPTTEVEDPTRLEAGLPGSVQQPGVYPQDRTSSPECECRTPEGTRTDVFPTDEDPSPRLQLRQVVCTSTPPRDPKLPKKYLLAVCGCSLRTLAATAVWRAITPHKFASHEQRQHWIAVLAPLAPNAVGCCLMGGCVGLEQRLKRAEAGETERRPGGGPAPTVFGAASSDVAARRRARSAHIRAIKDFFLGCLTTLGTLAVNGNRDLSGALLEVYLIQIPANFLAHGFGYYFMECSSSCSDRLVVQLSDVGDHDHSAGGTTSAQECSCSRSKNLLLGAGAVLLQLSIAGMVLYAAPGADVETDQSPAQQDKQWMLIVELLATNLAAGPVAGFLRTQIVQACEGDGRNHRRAFLGKRLGVSVANVVGSFAAGLALGLPEPWDGIVGAGLCSCLTTLSSVVADTVPLPSNMPLEECEGHGCSCRKNCKKQVLYTLARGVYFVGINCCLVYLGAQAAIRWVGVEDDGFSGFSFQV